MNAVLAAIERIKQQAPPPEPDKPLGEAIVGFLVLMLLLALFFAAIERLWPEQADQPGTLSRKRERRGVDLCFWVLNHIIDRKVAGFFAFLMILYLAVLQIPTAAGIVGRQPLWLQGIEAVIALDAAAYWIHRAQHWIPQLWRLHCVHHSSPMLDWLAGGRTHPVENIMARVMAIAPLYLLGFSPVVYAAAGPVLGLMGVMLHANVRWTFGRVGRYVVSPAYHRVHHGADAEFHNCNFAGVFTHWDRMMGTVKWPEPQRYGLDEAPRTVMGLLRYPFTS